MLLRLEKYTRALFILSLSVTLALYFLKDRLPPPAFYDIDSLADPRQWPTQQKSFVTRVHDEQYRIKPLYDYELDGVIVSYHNADDFTDIWHHERWRDFINLRDLCVIWGNNVASGVYHEMDFHNDSWTCWVSVARWCFHPSARG